MTPEGPVKAESPSETIRAALNDLVRYAHDRQTERGWLKDRANDAFDVVCVLVAERDCYKAELEEISQTHGRDGFRERAMARSALVRGREALHPTSQEGEEK